MTRLLALSRSWISRAFLLSIMTLCTALVSNAALIEKSLAERSMSASPSVRTPSAKPSRAATLVFSFAGEQAQTCPPSCSFPSGSVVSVLFDPQAPRVETGYRIYINGAKVGADIPAAVGAVTITVPAITLPASGTVKVKVGAISPAGASPVEVFSDELTLTLVVPPPPAPGKPINLKVVLSVTVAANGSVKVEVVSAAPVPTKQPSTRK